MKKKVLALSLAAAMAFSLAACGGGGESGDTVANKDKPVVWFNRQPSNATTGELDADALNFNEDTYYVGFDANQGAELQGTMILDYIKANIADIDRNGDGIIGYVLAIGDKGHNDSIARTRGVRSALGTAVKDADGNIISEAVGTNVDGKSEYVQDGKLEIDGKTYTVRELASQEMKNSAGATWDGGTAGNAIDTWASAFGDQIDVVASNNDGMGMNMFLKWSQKNEVPTFGSISQHADVQAYLTLRVIRNALDGVDMDTGIGTEDAAGNVLSEDVYKYDAENRSYYALNVAVTAENYEEFLDSTVTWKPVSNKVSEETSPKKKVWLNIYNSADNFLGSTYKPLLEKYDDLLNLDVEYIQGDGQSENSVADRLTDPSAYDAFAINMVKTDNAVTYTTKLAQ